jgi:hypothetical protein
MFMRTHNFDLVGALCGAALMAVAVIGAVTVGGWVNPAHAAEPDGGTTMQVDIPKPTCQFTWTQLTEVSDELVANHANIKETVLTGAKAKNLLALVNAQPGADIDFDGVVFLENTNTEQVKVAYSKDGCVFKVFEITAAQFKQVMKGLTEANP